MEIYSIVILIISIFLLLGAGYCGRQSLNNLTDEGEKRIQESLFHRPGFGKTNYTKIGLKYANLALWFGGIGGLLMFFVLITLI